MGEGEKEKREGERVMIKLHCEPSCKLSQSKGATETGGTGSATEQAKKKGRIQHNNSLLSDVKRARGLGLDDLLGELIVPESCQTEADEHTATCVKFCDSGEERKKRKAGQRSELDLIHLLLDCIPTGCTACGQTD